MDAAAPVRRKLADGGGHCGAPIASLCDPVAVAEPLHQFGPGARNALDPPARLPRLARKTVTGQRWRDDMEGGRRRIRRLDQFVDHAEEFDHRPRPAMRDDQRQRVLARRALVEEMDIEPVDLGDKLADGIETRFAAPPVIFDPPIGDQFPERRQPRALRPVVDRFFLGPAGLVEPVGKRHQLVFGNGEFERADRGHAGSPVAFFEAATTRLISASRIVLVALASTLPSASLRWPS